MSKSKDADRGEDLKAKIRARYGQAARAAAGGQGCGCGPAPAAALSCCGPASAPSCCGSGSGETERLDRLIRADYRPEELAGLPASTVTAGFGCGNPAAAAEFVPGEVVLDLGSGGGIDVFLAARRVGPAGKVYGLDFTDEMLELARANQLKAGLTNVEFLRGDMEDIPLPDASVDSIISNCVINLAVDKSRVLTEAFRVLRPGGRLTVSDIVFQGDTSRLPASFRRDAEAWAGCVAGALEERDYLARLGRAGFIAVSLEATGLYPPPGAPPEGPAGVPAGAPPGESRGGLRLPAGLCLASGLIRARKPGTGQISLRPAQASDLARALRLLREARLPTDGVEELFPDGFAVAWASGQLAGVAGLEVHGPDGLLRSIAVDAAWRGRGVGSRLVRDRLEKAGSAGLGSVWLLTPAAATFFERFGFARASRDEAPATVLSSGEFEHVCPTATAMRLTL